MNTKDYIKEIKDNCSLDYLIYQQGIEDGYIKAWERAIVVIVILIIIMLFN